MDLHRYEDAAESFDKIIKINSEMGDRLPRKRSLLLDFLHPNGYEQKALGLKKLVKWEEVLECYNQLIKR
jgi:tetratricopeptide (TPR) repeat protein